ncbi:MAG: M20 metallopeptidase family protein [Caulobacteraceae bacterium]
MIKPYIKSEEEYIISLRRYFHQNPEPSMEEYNTALKIEEELDAIGIEHKRIGDTGVFGVIRGKRGSNKRVILRADIDALRMQDLKKESYASQKEGFMHACGHDAHTAALLGAAKVLKAKAPEFAGEIYLFFQQGEEFGQGARVFIREGLLSGASRVFGIHAASNIPVGQVAVTKGPVNASVDHFTITVKGQSAHVSTPQKGVDALYIASQIVVNLQAIVSRQTDPIDTVLVGIGVLRAGTAYNIVANEAVIEGTTRCFSIEARTKTNGSIAAIAKQLGAAFGAEVQLDFEDFASPLVNDEAVCDEVAVVAGDIVGTENVVRQEKSLGGDDFAEYLLQVPGMYAFVGTGNKDKPNTMQPHHCGLFDIDEQGILIAANLYTDYVLQQLK